MLVGASALLAWAFAVVRLVDVGIASRPHWVAEARRQQERAVKLAPERGSILDARGREVAISAPAWSAWADPTALADTREKDAAARRLAAVLGAPRATLQRRLRQEREFVWLERRLSPEQRDRVAGLAIPGVAFVKESRRLYPLGGLASDLLGVVGVDQEGLEGLEFALESEIAGTPGLLLTMRDARGDAFLPGGVSFKAAERGADVVLTLDAVVQHVVERELKAALARTGARSGIVIVMFPSTGEVLALSNQPTTDPNNLPAHPSHLRTNRAVASCYEPGSTLKIFTAAAALERGVRPGEVVDCEGGATRVGRTRIRDHRSFGLLPFSEIIAASSNVGAIKLGQRAGAPALGDVLHRFGFGRRTGIDFPAESAGVMSDPSRWSPQTLAAISFGQEIAVSPIQLITAVSGVAAGGLLPSPHLVGEVRRPDGTIRRTTPAPHRVISQDVASSLTTMLEGVVDHGTGTAAAIPGYQVAGKTGTAQKIGAGGTYLEDAFVASFVGWVPSRNPGIAILVILDEPRGAYHGGEVAAPVFAAIARDILRHLEIPPDAPGHVLGVDARNDAALAEDRHA